MAEPSGEDGRHRRGLRFRKRDDHAIELFREIKSHLADIARVNTMLLELGRFYNPYVDAPIVDLPTRKRIVGLLEAGRAEEAGKLLDERLEAYARTAEEGEGAREAP